MKSLWRYILTTLMLGLFFGAAACTKKKTVSKRESPSAASQPTANDKPAGGDEIVLEEPADPNTITGTYLTYERGRPRCYSQAVAGTPDEFQVHCHAVQVINGAETPAAKLDANLEASWLDPVAPNVTGFAVQSCSVAANFLAQSCRVKVPVATSTVDVTFSLRLSETKASSGQPSARTRVDTDIVSLPFAVQAIGFVPEVASMNLAHLTSSLTTGPEKNWLMGASATKAAEFPLGEDTRLQQCDGALQVATRGRLFSLKSGVLTHVAGSTNPNNIDNTTHPLRTVWNDITALACNKDAVTFTTSDPFRVMRLRGETLTIPSKSFESVAAQPVNAVHDGKGILYYINAADGILYSVNASDVAQPLFDTNAKIFAGLNPTGDIGISGPPGVYSLALDEDAAGVVNGFYFLVFDSVTFANFVVRTDLSGDTFTKVAGNGAPPDTSNRNDLNATAAALRPGQHLSTAKNSAGERLLIIVEANTPGTNPATDPVGEILSVTSDGKLHVLYQPGDLTLVDDSARSVMGAIGFSGASGQVTEEGANLLVKALFKASGQTATVILRLPVTGGVAPVWVAGSLPAAPALLAGGTIDTKKLSLGATISAFGSDGTLYIADNGKQKFYRMKTDDSLTPILGPAGASPREPLSFTGQVLSMAVYYAPVENKYKIYYIEDDSTNKAIKLLDPESGDVSVVTATPACDIANPASEVCAPVSLTVSSSGLVVYFDAHYRIIRRINANGSFTKLAGSSDFTRGTAARFAGNTQTAGNVGFGRVTAMSYDMYGNLVFVDSGAWHTDVSNSTDYEFKPMLGSIASTGGLSATVTTIAGDTATNPAVAITGPNERISTADMKLTAPNYAVSLPDGSILLHDNGTMMAIQPVVAGGYTARRFFGGKNTNPDCGVGTIDRNAQAGSADVPTLSNAMARFCTGPLHHISSLSECSPADPTKGKVYVAIGQSMSASGSYTGSGNILKMEVACDAIKASL